MLELLFDRRHRVLMARFSGTLTVADLAQSDVGGRAVLAREGAMRSILDFSAVGAIDVPSAEFAARGRRPAIVGSQRRIYVVPRPELFGLARMYATHQQLAGGTEPLLVVSLAAALDALGIADAAFEPEPPP
jgi:hypothetical protein